MSKFTKRILAFVLTAVMIFSIVPAGVINASALTGSTNEEKIWNYLRSKGFNAVATAAIMGNMKAESGYAPNNLQNSYEQKLGYNDTTYTNAVDKGSYSKSSFIKDSAGYGLVQWTYWSRKENLYNSVKSENRSIGDLEAQLNFLVKEIKTYKTCYNDLKDAKSIETATKSVMNNYEKPAVRNADARIANAKAVYNTYNSSGIEWMWPLPGRKITSGYGYRTYKGKRSFHEGVDIGAPKGTVIYAARGGKVTCSTTKNVAKCAICQLSGAGIHIEIKVNGYDNKLFNTYSHMSKSYVKTGDTVISGQAIGEVGATGNADGAHCHFAMTKTKNTHAFFKGYTVQNPLDYVKPGDKIGNITITLDGLAENTNTYVKVKSHLNTSANVQQITYIYSTNPKDIIGRNFAANTNNLGLGTQVEGDKQAVKAWAGSSNLKNMTTTIKNLKPGTQYYYCLLIKANNKWWQSTTDSAKVGKFTTANVKPEAVTLSLEKNSADIGIGDTASVSWNDAKYNSSYKITLLRNGQEVHSKDNIQGFSYSFEGDYINTPGEYTAKLEAKNNAAAVSAKNEVTFTVHDDVTVTFYADENCDDIVGQKSVPYGHSSDAPEPPQREGYEFAGWVGADDNQAANYQSVTENAEFIPSYKIKTYTVTFINGETGETIAEREVEYGNAADAPDLPQKNGYVYAWDTDFSSVKSDLTVKAVSSWYNENYPLSIDKYNSTFTRDESGNGYDFSVVITRNGFKNDAISGRLIIALKNNDGYMFTKTDSAAFNFGRNPNNESEKNTLIVRGFVASDIKAESIEIFTVKSYEDAAVLAAPIKIEENLLSNDNDKWSEWYDEDEWNAMNISGIETDTRTLYKSRSKITATSTATSLAGYTQDENNPYTAKKKSTGSVEYVKKWATYYKTGTTLYNTYNKTPMKASETATTITEINGESVVGLIYWHWCKGRTSGRAANYIASGDANDKKDGFTTFHAFYHAGAAEISDKGLAVSKNDNSGCKDSWFWWNKNDVEHAAVRVYKQNYTVYDKVYNYYKYTEWSDWSETPAAGSSDTVQTKTQYRYEITEASQKYAASPDATTVSDLKQLDAESFAGKAATVFIYKYTEPSDYTNEAVISTKVNDDGTINLGEVYLRETATYETGDFTIAAAIEGQSDLIEIGMIEAEPAQFNVTFRLPDGTQIGETQIADQGDTVQPPEESDFEVPEGMYLKGWNQSTANIQSNLEVEAVFAPKTYVVVFIDWGKKEFELKEYQYGDIVAIPGYEEADGKVISWDLSGLNKIDEELKDDEGNPVLDEDGNAVINSYYTVKGNAVVTTDYVDQVNEARFILPKTEDSRDLIDSLDDAYENADEIVVDEEGNEVAKKDTPEFAGENGIIDNLLKEADISDGTEVIGDIKYNDYIPINDEINEIMDNDEVYLFYGWRSVKTGEFLNDLTSEKATDTYYPSFDFGRTAEVPEASVETGEYDDTQFVTLSCGTENAVIYYTLDGSDPRDVNNANVHQYNGSAITISRSTTLTAYAAAMNYNDSDLGTYLYAIGGTHHVLIVYNDSNIEGDNALVTLQRDNTRLPSDAYRTLDGHTFEGIYTDAEHTDEFDYDSEFVTSDLVDEETGLIELYAHYIPDSYNIAFADDTGRVLKETTAFWGEKAEEPEESELAKEGYVFVGWNSDDYTFVTEDGVFTARYVREDEYAKISFKRTKYSILANSDKQIAYTITPAELSGTEIDWETDNSDVATVDYKGVVTGVNPGTATITATVRTTGESASATFTVSEDPDQVVTLAKSSSLGLDSQGNIRGLDADKNTVNEIKDEFISENLKFFDHEGNELTGEDKIGTGALVRLLDDDGVTVLNERVIILTGDADCDGYITNRDSGYIARFLVEKETADTYQMIALDVNGDGDVNVRDASMLAQYLVGKATLAK